MTYITHLTGRKAMSISQIMTMVLTGFVVIVLQSSTAHAQWTTGTNINNTNTGNVGIGTTSPTSKLEIQAADGPLTLSQAGVPGKVTLQAAIGTDLHLSANAKYVNPTWNRFDTTRPAWNIFASPSADYAGIRRAPAGAGAITWTDLLRITNTGNVGIGTSTPSTKLHVVGDGTITGNLTVTGNIAAKYQDVAEWVESSQQLAAGTVVVLDQTKSNQVIASSQAYDTRVAGVISAQPGITLGVNGAGKVLVATTGRVRIKVDASRGSIQVGDLLVTSDVAGVAMKSQPIDVGGVQIHRPGTLIGKALEPLTTGTGEILVLLSLQ
jgi:hypothetical protein